MESFDVDDVLNDFLVIKVIDYKFIENILVKRGRNFFFESDSKR